MVKSFRYKFESRSQKHQCPDCQKKTFVRYKDSETGEQLPEQYGRCDRESNCGYHLNPYRDGYARQNLNGETNSYPKVDHYRAYKARMEQKPTHTFPIPVEVLKSTLKGYEQNVFVQNLKQRIPYPFDTNDIEQVNSLYKMGTISEGYRAGAVTFPFIDIDGNIRAVQVKQFDENCHTTGTDQLHSVLSRYPFVDAGKSVFDPVTGKRRELLPDWMIHYLQNENKFTCLFGEHLLRKFPRNTVALVEAPKTAIMATLYMGFPLQPENLLWLAVGSLSYLNLERCWALHGRNVILFPDLSKNGTTYQKWSRKANELSEQMPGTSFKVFDLLEHISDEKQRESGHDLADFLITQDWRKFRYRNQKVETAIPEQIENSAKSEPLNKTYSGEVTTTDPITTFNNQPRFSRMKYIAPEDWTEQITELESYFAETTIPTHPIKLNICTTLLSPSYTIATHFTVVKANNGNPTFRPYLERLQELKYYLTKLNICCDDFTY